MRTSRLSVLLLAAATCAGAQTVPPARPADAAKPRYGSWGVDETLMDKSTRPGADFFGYSLGSWLRDVPIPADKARAGFNYDLPDETEADVRGIVEASRGQAGTPAYVKQIVAFYDAYMDQAGIEARGTAPLKPYLARIAAVNDRRSLVMLMAEPVYAAPFGIGIGADDKDPRHYVVQIGQARLGLPNRDYYLLTGAKYDAIRAAYRAYLVRIQTLAGIADAEAKADAILKLETRLAQDQWTPERRRDPQATYNAMTPAALARLAPQVDWAGALAHLGLPPQGMVIVREPSAVAAAAARVGDVPLQTWKDWMAVRFISNNAQYLPKAFDEANFAFYGKTLSDVPAQAARWKRAVRLLNADLGEAVGQLYVAKHWTPETAAQVNELIGDMRAAYADKITHANWMDDATRKEALAKLAAFDPRVGHPVNYVDYAAMPVSSADPLANAVAADTFEWKLQLSRFPKPVDRTLWDMTPQEVNAYYDPTQNQVTFPAAQLQPPFFDAAADPAVNYGETGATIGHEMGHGFDDEGRQYDAQGRLRDWWTKDAAARYTVHAQALVKQFDGYQPLPGVFIKGQLTLGENLADLGGLEVAYDAYHRYVARHGEPKVIDGLTGDQRFFIAYAQSWEGKARDGALRQQLLSNPHSPEQYRVNGIVRNMDEWYAAFGVKPGDALYLPPAERVHVW
jgi:endothelin-converting enzyme/putative endopeptidase